MNGLTAVNSDDSLYYAKQCRSAAYYVAVAGKNMRKMYEESNVAHNPALFNWLIELEDRLCKISILIEAGKQDEFHGFKGSPSVLASLTQRKSTRKKKK